MIEPVFQLEEHEPREQPHDFIASDLDPAVPINQDITNGHVHKDVDIIMDSYHHDVTSSNVGGVNNDRFRLDHGKFFGHHGSHHGKIGY